MGGHHPDARPLPTQGSNQHRQKEISMPQVRFEAMITVFQPPRLRFISRGHCDPQINGLNNCNLFIAILLLSLQFSAFDVRNFSIANVQLSTI
jgi:hypothetical protein